MVFQGESLFLVLSILVTCLKVLLLPAPHSTDFEVHRNWLAITHSLPLKDWYYDANSEWTLDYPPIFAYFEYVLSQVAQYIEPAMLLRENHNYASSRTVIFQKCSVIVVDLVYMLGVWRLLKTLANTLGLHTRHYSAEAIHLFNIGLLFVDHIHFQYNGLLMGLFLISISFLLEEHYLSAAFLFAFLINMKHIFLYVAPVIGVYLLLNYCCQSTTCRRQKQCQDKEWSWSCSSTTKLLMIGLIPFIVSFGPFCEHLPQIISRLFPFGRGLTHAYWAPNFWSLYNTLDKILSILLRIPKPSEYTAGLVQQYDHLVLPNIRPFITFLLTILAMLPVLWKLFQLPWNCDKRVKKVVFLRALVLCSMSSFMFGWHVHEKAILMSTIPLSFLIFYHETDAKYAFLLSAAGYWSIFPLLFHSDLLILRYTMYLAYMIFMFTQTLRFYDKFLYFNAIESLYIIGLVVILPVYEHLVAPLTGLDVRLPFLLLLLTSLYCSLGISYVYIRYYILVMSLQATDLQFYPLKEKIR